MPKEHYYLAYLWVNHRGVIILLYRAAETTIQAKVYMYVWGRETRIDGDAKLILLKGKL